VGRQRWWNPVELLRPPSEVSDSGSKNHATRLKGLAIRKRHLEAAPAEVDTCDAASLNVRNYLALIPKAILDKLLKRYWCWNLIASRDTVGIQCHFLFGICNMRGFPIGPEKHPGRHSIFPKCHRIAEDARLYTSRPQKSGGRQTVRTNSNYSNVSILHVISTPLSFVF
jgi:hypothetical protein